MQPAELQQCCVELEARQSLLADGPGNVGAVIHGRERHEMTILRLKNTPRRCLALVAIVATAAGCMTAANAAPASARPAASVRQAVDVQPAAYAQPNGGADLCFTNDTVYCVGVDSMTIFVVVSGTITTGASVITVVLTWIAIKNSQKQDQGEEKSDGPDDTGLCLAATGGDAYMTSCGANGTVWIVVPHSDGDYLESRYSVDNGLSSKMLTAYPLAQGYSLYVYPPEQPGGDYWQTWSWYQLLSSSGRTAPPLVRQD